MQFAGAHYVLFEFLAWTIFVLVLLFVWPFEYGLFVAMASSCIAIALLSWRLYERHRAGENATPSQYFCPKRVRMFEPAHLQSKARQAHAP